MAREIKSRTLLIAGILAVAAVLSITAAFIFPAAQILEEAGSECYTYCIKQPHISCIGKWEISGDYPDCSCSYLCTASEQDTEDSYISLLVSYGFDLKSLYILEDEAEFRFSGYCDTSLYPNFGNMTNIGVPNVFDYIVFDDAENYCINNDIAFDFSWVKTGQNYTQYMMYRTPETFCSTSAFISADGDIAFVENSKFEECLQSYFG